MLANKFSIDNHLQFRDDPAGFTRAMLVHDSGTSTELFLYGAHITSWKTPESGERLFVSREVIIEKDIPIRGGIPLIFPQFGPDDWLNTDLHVFIFGMLWKVEFLTGTRFL